MILYNLCKDQQSIRTNGLSGKDRVYYTRDRLHGDLEKWDRFGNHMGSVDSKTGVQTKPPVPGRTLPEVR